MSFQYAFFSAYDTPKRTIRKANTKKPKNLRKPAPGSPAQTRKPTRSATCLLYSVGDNCPGTVNSNSFVVLFSTCCPCSSHRACGIPTLANKVLFQPVGRC